MAMQGVAALDREELLTVTTLTCFKAYDIRGQLGAELNENVAYRIGRAYAQFLDAKRIVIGGDMRLSTAGLKQALANGLMDAGCDVIDLGMTGTEEVYFAAFHLDVDGGIEVTASHNPIDFNGMKLVRRGAQPISGDTGLKDIQALAEADNFAPPGKRGNGLWIAVALVAVLVLAVGAVVAVFATRDDSGSSSAAPSGLVPATASQPSGPPPTVS